MQLFKKTGFFAISALLAVTLVGCNTIHGVGEDLTAGGKAISSAAQGGSGQQSSQVKTQRAPAS